MNDRFAKWIEENPLAAIPLTIAFLGALFTPVLVVGIAEWPRAGSRWWDAGLGVAWAAALVLGFRRRPSAWWSFAALPAMVGLPSFWGGNRTGGADVKLFTAAFLVSGIPPLCAYLVVMRFRSWKTGVPWDGSVDAAPRRFRSRDDRGPARLPSVLRGRALLVVVSLVAVAAFALRVYSAWQFRRDEQTRRELVDALHRDGAVWRRYYEAALAPPRTRPTAVFPGRNAVSDAARTSLRKGVSASEFFTVPAAGVQIDAIVDPGADVVDDEIEAIDPTAREEKGIVLTGVLVTERFAFARPRVTYVRLPGYVLPGGWKAQDESELKPRWVKFEMSPQSFASIDAPTLLGKATASARFAPDVLLGALTGATTAVDGSPGGAPYHVSFDLDGSPVSADVSVARNGTIARVVARVLTADCENLDMRMRPLPDRPPPALPPRARVLEARSLGT